MVLYLRLLVDYRPEECHKCQFSVTDFFLQFFSPDTLCKLVFFLPLFLNHSTLLPPQITYCM